MNQKVWLAEMCWFARLRAVVQSWMPSSQCDEVMSQNEVGNLSLI